MLEDLSVKVMYEDLLVVTRLTRHHHRSHTIHNISSRCQELYGMYGDVLSVWCLRSFRILILTSHTNLPQIFDLWPIHSWHPIQIEDLYRDVRNVSIKSKICWGCMGSFVRNRRFVSDRCLKCIISNNTIYRWDVCMEWCL